MKTQTENQKKLTLSILEDLKAGIHPRIIKASLHKFGYTLTKEQKELLTDKAKLFIVK